MKALLAKASKFDMIENDKGRKVLRTTTTIDKTRKNRKGEDLEVKWYHIGDKQIEAGKVITYKHVVSEHAKTGLPVYETYRFVADDLTDSEKAELKQARAVYMAREAFNLMLAACSKIEKLATVPVPADVAEKVDTGIREQVTAALDIFNKTAARRKMADF